MQSSGYVMNIFFLLSALNIWVLQTYKVVVGITQEELAVLVKNNEPQK